VQLASSPPRSARVYSWIAIAGIGAALIVAIVASLARASWMGPPLVMPKVGPPFEISSWHISLNTMNVVLWLSATAGGVGVTAGLIAVRRGARPPVKVLLVIAALVVAVLTVLPPFGSPNSKD